MGMGYTVFCKNCNYEFDLMNDYGGTYDWETYLCQNCNSYFNHRILRYCIFKERKIPRAFIKCEFCNSRNIKRVHDEDIVDCTKLEWDQDIKARIKCPKCGSRMMVNVIDFDD